MFYNYGQALWLGDFRSEKSYDILHGVILDG